jgi:hypothetical protein
MLTDYSIAQTESRVKASFAFTREATLTDIRLFSCEAQGIRPGARDSDETLGLEGGVESRLVGREERTVTFAVEVVSQAIDVTKPLETPLTRVRVAFHLEYQLGERYEPSEDELDAFREGNAIFHCWPYAREMVSKLNMRLRLNGPPLPMLYLRQKPDEYPKPKVRRVARAAGKGMAE